VARTPGGFSPAHAAGLSLRVSPGRRLGSRSRKSWPEVIRAERAPGKNPRAACHASQDVNEHARPDLGGDLEPDSLKPRSIKGTTGVTDDRLTLIIDRRPTEQCLSDAQSRPCPAPEDHRGNEKFPSLSIALVWMGAGMGAMAKAPETAYPPSQGPKRVPRAGLEPARPFEQSILSAPCLPFHHPGEVAPISIPGCWSRQERATTQVDDQSAEILVSRCHLVLGVTDVVHAQPIGRARYAGR
jgi:hypothetical protein